MGITLNVWVFSGIIGVAYIMGYLMSRTMGRVLAIEGADPEAAQGEEAWAWGKRGGKREKSGKALFQAAAVLTRRAPRSEAAEMPGRASYPGAAEMSGRAPYPGAAAQYGSTMRWEASATTWQEETEVPETAAWQAEPAMSERMAGRREMAMAGGKAGREESVLAGGKAGREAAMMSGRQAWTGETDWEENTEPEGAVLQEARTRTERADRAARQPYRAGHGGEVRQWQRARIQRRYRGRSHREQQAKPAGHPIASPVAGQVDVLESQGRRGVLLTPEDNRVYAPASGKIIRLYPRGNEFLLRTDSGVVLRLRAGERDADMTRDYFRPRIMQNEFVGKGKLLLEYDREALARDGYDTHVSMTVEEGERSYDLSVTGSMWVKNGQDCLWVL